MGFGGAAVAAQFRCVKADEAYPPVVLQAQSIAIYYLCYGGVLVEARCRTV
jgi:hypothetical protein